MSTARHAKGVQGQPLFTFAVVADTHIQSPQDKPSPWKTNNLAGARSRLAYEQIAATEPVFIVHLGDVTNPVPHAPTFDTACEAALEVLNIAPAKTHFVAGNHDVGDKISRIIPNHPIDDFSIQKFEKRWGSSWSAWDHQGVHFVIINSSLVGSRLPQESQQLRFLEDDLAAHAGQRIFLFSHYPLFMESPDEVSLYDNIEPEGRAHLLALVNKYNVEAAVAGHVHNFFYNVFGSTELYGLLSTTFVRHDYAEMFAASPADEYGRNDTPKLGWAEVCVYESGHILRTHRLLEPLRSASSPLLEGRQAVELHPKTLPSSALGTNLRQAWAEAKPLMYYGPVDEFERRKVRNDYLQLALWESGIRHLRVPLRDLTRKEYVDRMGALAAIGHTFTAFAVDVPDGELLNALLANEHLLEGLEVIIPWLEVDDHIPKLEQLVSETKVQIYLACVSAALDHRKKAYQFAYFMSYGFYADEIELLTEVHDRFGRRLGLGYTFRIGPTESPVVAGSEIISSFVTKQKVAVTFNIASYSTVSHLRDDSVATTTRAIEATLLGLADGGQKTRVFLETLIDVNTGYNPSIGLYNALYNPQEGARVVANLQAVAGVMKQSKSAGLTLQVTDDEEAQIRRFDVSFSQGKSMTIMSPITSAAIDTFVNKVRSMHADKLFSLATLSEVTTETTSSGPVLLV